MPKNPIPEDMRPYYRYGMSLMQLMSLLIVLGLTTHFTLKYFFS